MSGGQMEGESLRARTSKGLDAIPEHGKDDSGYNAEIAEPETKRRPVEDREGYVKPGADRSVEDDNNSDDDVS